MGIFDCRCFLFFSQSLKNTYVVNPCTSTSVTSTSSTEASGNVSLSAFLLCPVREVGSRGGEKVAVVGCSEDIILNRP